MQTQTPSRSYTGPISFVRSDRNPSRFYAVGVDAASQLYTCECPDHINRHRDCKHIAKVQRGQVQPATVKQDTRPLLTVAPGSGFGFEYPS